MPLDNQHIGHPIELYSLERVIQLSGLSKTTIYKEIQTGRLESVKIHSRRLIPSDAYDRWISELRAPRDATTGAAI